MHQIDRIASIAPLEAAAEKGLEDGEDNEDF
jgi:hypothetical protein